MKKSYFDTHSNPLQAVKSGPLPNFIQSILLPTYFFPKSDIAISDACFSQSNRYGMALTCVYVPPISIEN